MICPFEMVHFCAFWTASMRLNFTKLLTAAPLTVGKFQQINRRPFWNHDRQLLRRKVNSQSINLWSASISGTPSVHLSPPVVGSLGSLATARLPLTKLLAHRTKTTAWNRCVDRWWRLKTEHRQAVDMTFWCFSIEMRVTSRRQHSNLQMKNAFAPLWFRNRSYVEPNNTFPLLP